MSKCVVIRVEFDLYIRFFHTDILLTVQTGYPPAEVLGRNCRFLQGVGTDKDTVRAMREAVSNGREFHGRLMNYHKNGTSLVNSLVMSPLRDERGVVTHFIGIQRLAPAKSLDDAPAEYQFRAAL